MNGHNNNNHNSYNNNNIIMKQTKPGKFHNEFKGAVGVQKYSSRPTDGFMKIWTVVRKSRTTSLAT